MEKNLFIFMGTYVNFAVYFDYGIDDLENIDAKRCNDRIGTQVKLHKLSE